MAANEQAQLLENAAAQSEVLPPTSPEAAKQQAETVARHRQSMLPEASDTTTNSTGSLATQVGTTGDVCSTEPLSRTSMLSCSFVCIQLTNIPPPEYSTNTSNTSNTCIILPSNTDICLQRSALLEQQPVTGISTINPHSELETTLATPARPSNVVTSYLPPNPDDLDISCSHDGDLSNIVYDAAVRGRAAPIFLEKQ